ncbi:MAG: type II secretion system F family protein [Candidatus Syntropharchaeales archaeon]
MIEMDLYAFLWFPPVRWIISLAVHAIIIFLIYRFSTRLIRRSKLYGKLKDRRSTKKSLAKADKKKFLKDAGAKRTIKKGGLVAYLRRIKVRGIKREHLTIIIPIVLAIVFVLAGAFLFPDSPEEDVPIIETSTPTPTPEPTFTPDIEPVDTLKKNLDKTIVIAALIGLTPYGLDVYLRKRRRIKYEDEFARFLFELSEFLRGGLDPVASVIELASSATPEVYRSIESLTPHIDHLAKQLEWGMTFEDGMYQMARDLKSELIEKYVYLVVQTSHTGGGIGEMILQCSEDMTKTLTLEREKEAHLHEYIVIIYIAQAILVAMLVLLQKMLIPALQGMSTGGIQSAGDFGFSITTVDIDFARSFFHIIMINGFASGIIGGVMSEGELRQGIKHSVILVAASFVICLIYLI